MVQCFTTGEHINVKKVGLSSLKLKVILQKNYYDRNGYIPINSVKAWNKPFVTVLEANAMRHAELKDDFQTRYDMPSRLTW